MNKVGEIPWPRILAEGGAIVISILLAFAIEAKWQEYVTSIEEEIILNSIGAEIDANLDAIDIQLQYHSDINGVIQRLFDAADVVLTLSPNEIDRHILEVAFWSRSGLNTSSIDSLSDAGNLSMISDKALRSELTMLRAKYQFVDGLERQEEEFMRHYLTPFLVKNAVLAQIANSVPKSYGSAIIGSTSDYPKGKSVDHSHLLQNDEFIGLLVQERWIHQDTMPNMEELRDLLLKLRSSIDEKLSDL